MQFEGERSKYSRYARASRPQSKRLVIYAVLLVAVVAAMIVLRERTRSTEQQPKAGLIEWLLTFKEATARAEANGKPIMLYFFAEGDEACARMDNATFADPAVRAEAAKFICVRLSVKAEPELAERYYAVGWPAVAFISPGGELLRTMLNEREPDKFLEEMQEALKPRKPTPDREATPDDEQLAESPGLGPRNAGPSRGEAE